MSKAVLDLIHSDLMGKTHPQSVGGGFYAITFIDDFSRFATVKILKSTDAAFDEFVKFKSLAENEQGRKLKALQTDNGGEYFGQVFEHYLVKDGITHYKIVPRCSPQLGIGERENRTLAEMGRCLLIQSVLPEKFWGEAITTACYIRNLCPSRSIDNEIHIQRWKGGDLDVTDLVVRLRVFGCRVWVLLDDSCQSLVQRRLKGFLWCMSLMSKAIKSS